MWRHMKEKKHIKPQVQRDFLTFFMGFMLYFSVPMPSIRAKNGHPKGASSRSRPCGVPSMLSIAGRTMERSPWMRLGRGYGHHMIDIDSNDNDM